MLPFLVSSTLQLMNTHSVRFWQLLLLSRALYGIFYSNMEKINLNYSKKNILIPSHNDYRLQLVAKTEHFIKRARWKALEFDGKLHAQKKKTYGFRTRNCPPTSEGLKDFEKDLMLMIRNIEFRKTTNDFQETVKQDIQAIRQSGKIVVSADKSANMYKMSKAEYKKHLSNCITSDYKKADYSNVNSINAVSKNIAKSLDLDDSMEVLQQSEAYLTVKDHKTDFHNRPSFRLINTSKTDIGRVSKIMLDEINCSLLSAINVNQWKNTKSVIEWFDGICGKRNCTFFQFDVQSFYPSITEELFNKAFDFAAQHVQIPDNYKEVIMHARRTLLFSGGVPWTKKNNTNDFDVPMGSFDGAEVCELVGAFMLHELSSVIDKRDIGLYRDDGLGVMRNIGGPEKERRKKKIIQIFKSHGLDVDIESNLKSVRYLDVEFDLSTNSYKPYRKPGSELLYVNRKSNHPPSVLKQIPQGVAKRLSDISSSEEIFRKAAPEYQEALRKSGYTDELRYEKSSGNSKRQRRRKILWYNPPFSANVKTNVGRLFLKLVRTHFHKNHRYHKIFNMNTIKVSYSCTRNVGSVIKTHNASVLRKEQPLTRKCSCPARVVCPLDNQCLESNILYEGTVTEVEEQVERDYVGLCSTDWKSRLGVHNQGFNHREHATRCELSKHIWNLKDSSKEYNLRWRLLKKVRGRLIAGACKLCASEKVAIINHPTPNRLLNSNWIQKCVHARKYLLAYSKPVKVGNDTMD